MAWSIREPTRRHRPRVAQADRRALERAGWRTLLEYREDQARDGDGMLVGVVPTWVAEAERGDVVVSVIARHLELVWGDLRAAVRDG
jgi:hypothetical protein